MKARVQVGDADVTVDLSRPVSLARELDFRAPQPRHFGAPPATSQPYSVPGFSGSVAAGASCNCDVVTLIPHCNGTHTECVGHLTREPLDVHRIVPAGLVPAILISVRPVAANASHETTEPPPHADDRLITRSAIENRWPRTSSFEPQALIIRTEFTGAGVFHDAATGSTSARSPPFLSSEAAQLLAERGIDHLVIDLPSIDREHDEGRLSAHRLFFGLPTGAVLSQASRPQATITELAHIPAELADGPYLLELQIPAWRGDAVPSRPLLYDFRRA